jgi:pimeloyl-ACP methyl ester carboxylesterase
VHDLYPHSDVIGFHYRGYAPSTGRIGAAALCADALLIHDFAVRRFPGRPVVATGFSIGSGIASWLASHRPLAGLILVTPFDSLEKVAAERMPWLPVRWLFRNPMQSAEWLRHGDLPVAVIAGGSDTLVRPARTDALRKAIPHLVYDRTIAGADHNDIYGRSAFQEAMREALAAIMGPDRR